MRNVRAYVLSLLLTLFNFNMYTSDHDVSRFAKKLRNTITAAATTNRIIIPTQTAQCVSTDSGQQEPASVENELCKRFQENHRNHYNSINDLRISRAPLLKSVFPEKGDFPPEFVLE